MPTMPVQLGYRKSRHGCHRCKTRRVKVFIHVATSLSRSKQKRAWLTTCATAEQCDEKKPCTACRRHAVACSLVDAVGGSGSERLPQGLGRGRDSLQRNAICKVRPQAGPVWTPRELPDPFPYFNSLRPSTVHPSSQQTDWITDLELMHHFTSVTCHTLSRAEKLPHIWQVEVPRMGVKYPFVMHQILAVAALHFGHLHSDQSASYGFHASRHQTEAVSGMRSTMANMTSAETEALFCASLLLNICAYATFTQPAYRDTEQPSIGNIIDIFYLVRGMNEIIWSSDTVLRQGVFAPFFTPEPDAASTPTLDSLRLHLGDFKTKVKASVYAEVLVKEADLFLFWIDRCCARTATPELRIVMAWPICISAELISLLRECNPAALALLAYYCVVVWTTEESTWHTKGWSTSAMKAITSSLSQDSEAWIQWPNDIILGRE